MPGLRHERDTGRKTWSVSSRGHDDSHARVTRSSDAREFGPAHRAGQVYIRKQETQRATDLFEDQFRSLCTFALEHIHLSLFEQESDGSALKLVVLDHERGGFVRHGDTPSRGRLGANCPVPYLVQFKSSDAPSILQFIGMHRSQFGILVRETRGWY